MAQQAPKKLTPEQKERLKDPKFIIALRAVKPLQRAKKQRNPTRG
jgi:hypothetical protein